MEAAGKATHGELPVAAGYRGEGVGEGVQVGEDLRRTACGPVARPRWSRSVPHAGTARRSWHQMSLLRATRADVRPRRPRLTFHPHQPQVTLKTIEGAAPHREHAPSAPARRHRPAGLNETPVGRVANQCRLSNAVGRELECPWSALFATLGGGCREAHRFDDPPRCGGRWSRG